MLYVPAIPTPIVRRIVILAAVSTLFAASLSGCGGFRREQRAQWRADAENACLRSGKVRETQYVRISKAIDGPGVCGADHPVKVSALESAVAPDLARNGNLILTSANAMLTSITPTATLSCPMVSNTDDWLGQDVQQAALTWFGQPMIELITFGSFSCRPMNNRAGARLSEHSFANAIDVKAFRFADGRTVTVAKGWRGTPEEQGFLRETLHSACNRYTTVLGPGSDALHYDHFHLDLARHSGNRRVCKPRIDMPAPPVASPGAYESRPMASGPVYKPAGNNSSLPRMQPPSPVDMRLPQQSLPRLTPSLDLQQTGNPDSDIEDYGNEQNFEGKYFDLTGSIRSKDDPPVVRQRPGPPKFRTSRTAAPLPREPAGK